MCLVMVLKTSLPSSGSRNQLQHMTSNTCICCHIYSVGRVKDSMPEVQVASKPSKAGNLNFDTITDITSSLENVISDNHMLGKGY